MLRIGQIELKLAAAAEPAAARPAVAAVSYRPDEQIIQRESFPSEIVAARTRARWLIWTVVVSFVAGFAIFALGPSLLHALATLF